MLKVAMLTTALLVAASTAAIEGAGVEPVATPAAAPPCRPGPAPTLACALRGDADGDGVISAAELANLAAPAPAADAMSLHAGQGAGLDFKEAAIESGGMLRSSLDREHPQPLIPALMSIAALMILLRRRPS